MPRVPKPLTKADESEIIDSYKNGTSLIALTKAWHIDVRQKTAQDYCVTRQTT